MIKNYLGSTTLAKLTAEGLLLPPPKEFETPLGRLSWSEQKIEIYQEKGRFSSYEITIYRKGIDPGLVLFIQNYMDYDKLSLFLEKRKRGYSIHGPLSDVFYMGLDRYEIHYVYFCEKERAKIHFDLLLEEFGRLNEPIIY